ncbi:hypothetical protein KFU94_69800 [Chloroflexi bacterium TSY]|nr:hypothetical protein [Chloroflexi bacterium TSY]
MSQLQHDHSHLFTIRLWTEKTDDGRVEYRGRVQHVLSGEMRFFRTWDSLTTFLVQQVDDGREYEGSLQDSPSKYFQGSV